MGKKNLAEDIWPDFFSTFFMFPFGIKETFHGKIINKIANNPNWQYQPYKMEHGIDYNEYMYFYPYIWDVLFTTEKKPGKTKGSKFFRYELLNNKNYFKVETLRFNGEKEKKIKIELPLKNLFLHLFPEVGVGILIYEIVNGRDKHDKSYNLHDYLFFLALGRRIFAPFVRSDVNIENINENVFKKLNNFNKNNRFNDNGILKSNSSIHSNEYPMKVELKLGDLNIPEDITESKSLYIYDKKINQYKPRLSDIITKILDTGKFSYEKNCYYPIIDDRMFTHTFFSIPDDYNKEITFISKNNKFINDLKLFFQKDRQFYDMPESVDLWYKMIFVDWLAPSCQNPLIKERILKESTYQRWSDYGTFNGFSRFSSVTVTNINKAGYLYNHFQSMYYQIAVILCFYRGALLYFSNKSEELAKLINRKNEKYGKVLRKVKDLHQNFILFRNKYWFKEVTAQDQGIEIFDLWSSKMRNNELLKDVENEIKELHMYVDNMVERRTAKRLNIITIIGGIFIPLSVVTSYFGMNLYFTDKAHKPIITVFKKFIFHSFFNKHPQFDEFLSILILIYLIIFLLVIVAKILDHLRSK